MSSGWESGWWTDVDAVDEVDVFEAVDRWMRRWVPYGMVFVVGLAAGYAWCGLAFNLF